MNIYNTILAVACSLTISGAIAANIDVSNDNMKKSQANYLVSEKYMFIMRRACPQPLLLPMLTIYLLIFLVNVR